MGTRPQHKPGYERLRALLRSVREAAGLTQRALGAKIKLHGTMVHRCETGDRRIDPVEFADWCRACGVDPGEQIRKIGQR